jgi:hypothetical protein
VATTVNNAFSEFMKDKVNIDPVDTKKARTSRDNLIDNIHALGDKDNFFNLYTEKDIPFGSFARRTKIRPLDDIDIMICIKADGSTYYEYTDRIEITVNDDGYPQSTCCNTGTKILNSTKVINKFISHLSLLKEYKKAELHKRGEAATLQLKSYTWNFDIVPCFFTKPTADGKTFYIIPDGSGNWKKTDPTKDRDKISEVNQKHEGRMLDTIRLVKYWNKRPTMPLIPSYTLECLLLNYFNNMSKTANQYIDVRFLNALARISEAIYLPVHDPKGIQGDLNKLSLDEQKKISQRALSDCQKALDAINLETKQNDHKSSIKKWGEIFGSDFPTYND